MSKNDSLAKMKEIVALNTKRHNHLQEEEDFEAYYRKNILQALDDVVRQVASERSRETSTSTAPLQKEQVSMAMRDFFAHFEGTYQSLMAAMFPGVSLTAGTRSAYGGTRLDTTDHSGDGAAAPQDHALERSLTPEEEKVRAGLPAWVVVECVVPDRPGTSEFAILWTGEDPAPKLPPLELSLNGQPRDGNLFYTAVRSKEDDKRQDKVTFVIFTGCKPTGFTVLEREDGKLAVDFMT